MNPVKQVHIILFMRNYRKETTRNIFHQHSKSYHNQSNADNNSSEKYILLCLVLCITLNLLNAQDKFSDNLKIMVNYHTGVILPEYQFLIYITEDYVRSLDISLMKETRGKNIWEQIYHYPSYGISLFYSTLGNDKVLGKEIALNYFFKVNLVTLKKFHFFNRMGIGVSYVTRKFDLETNYMNVAVGSHFNIHYNCRLGVDYNVLDKLEFNLGLSLDHFSNANTREPNFGINYLTAYGGLTYLLGKKMERQEQEITPHVKKNHYELFASIGGKYTRALFSDYYVTSSLSFEMLREFTRVFHGGLGADMFYDPSVESQMKLKDKEYKDIYDFQMGIHLSQALVYNRISVMLQEGFYLILTDHLNNYKVYTRGILRYSISKRFSVRISMKSHFHVLDYPELGIGFAL